MSRRRIFKKEESMKKKAFAMIMAMTMAASLLAACGSSAPAQAPAEAQTQEEAAPEESEEEPPAGDLLVYRVGIVKFIDHPSLNQIEANVQKELDALSDDTVKYEYAAYTKNGQGDGASLQQIYADLLADDGDRVDILIPIATPAAAIAQSAAEGMDMPIVFSAVSDPVASGLVASMDAPGANITGTSDALNTNAIMDLIFAADPDADYIGLLYCNGEDASKNPIADAKAYLDAKGVKYIEKTGTTTDEVSQAVDALIAEKVDAVFTPTDNTIQNAELAFFEKLQDAGIPHYAGADSFALNGAFCGYGVDYALLGRETADMAAEILNGADPAATAVRTFDNGIATVNTETCEKVGFDMEQIRTAFGPFCTQIQEIVTGQEFE